MAKANITLDTETGKLEVTVGGKKVENANYVSVGAYKVFDYEKNVMVNKVGFTVEVQEQSDDGVMKHTRMMAKYTEDGQEALAQGNPIYSKHEDFVEVSQSSNVEEEALKLLR